MQSMHQVRTLNSVAPHVQQQLIQQELNPTGQQQQQDQLGMTVLESLEPAQAGQQQQQQQTVIHHLAPAPLLHQLQPSNRQLLEQHHELEQQLEQQELSQRNEDHQRRPANSSSQTASRQHRRDCVEGIVADGGGPIVQWLLENYEIADGESLPRSTVYNHYLAHCRSMRMSSVNAASFGKLIRSVFVGLKTRRLGTRGHSKYHYFGVRAKQHVRFEWPHETGTSSANSEGSRAGCSSAMLRDSNLNCDTNSNCGSDGGGQCGSETDSTGNCSGRLSTSMSAAGHLNQSGQINSTPNGTNPTSVATTPNNVHSNKRLKRVHMVCAAPDDHYHNLQQQQQARQEHNLGADLDQQQHHHQVHYSHQSEQSANGLQYHGMTQSNGYDKQDLFVCTVANADEQRVDFAQWPSTQLSQYDLANLRNHLNLEKAASLVHDHWPEREPGLLEGLVSRQHGSGANEVRESGSAGASDSQDCRLERLLEPFESQYKFHYKRLVELLSELNFAEVERLWADFWRPQAAAHWPANSVELSADSAQRRRQQQQSNSNYDQQDSTPSGRLTFGQLYELTSRPAIIERVAQIDQKLFAAIEKFLVVDILNPLPRALIQHLRSFARQVCGWQEAAVKDYCGEFVAQKVRSARAFELALRRSTSINHLSSAARAIWSKRSVLSQMSVDLGRLDLSDLEHQVASLMDQEKFTTLAEVVVGGGRQDRDDQLASRRHSHLLPTGSVTKPIDGQQHEPDEKTTVISSGSAGNIQEANDNIENTYTSQQHLNSISSQQQQQNRLGHNPYNCTQAPNTNQTNNVNFLIHFDQASPLQPGQLVQNFLHLLEDPFPAGQWPHWCRALVESRVSGRSLEEARDFILKWNFYISLILRELTLKSAPSLGSFQLIRLLFDEFMYYLVLSKLQQAAVQSADETNKAKFHQSQHSI